MSETHNLSAHLAADSRREHFRMARQVLQDACGEQTVLAASRLVRPAEAAPPPATPPRPGVRLTCYLKDGTHVFPLHIGMNQVGRLPDNDVVIRDECVSRRHCAVLVHSDFRCELHDVASKNGTLLNGKPIAGPTRLQSGDHLLLCKKPLTFVIAEAES